MSEVQNELADALARATNEPLTIGNWEKAEAIAASSDNPDPVAKSYRDAIAALDENDAVKLGEHATRFHEEWFGPEASETETLLRGILERSPSCDWAFRKLTANLTVAGNWETLLSLYDQAVENCSSESRKIEILDEAYQTATDLAQDSNKAAQYLNLLWQLQPTPKRQSELENLLESSNQWQRLIEVWTDDKNGEVSPQTNIKVAKTYIRELKEPNSAVSLLSEMLSGSEAKQSSELLEEILSSSPDTTTKSRCQNALREYYRANGQADDEVRLLEQEIANEENAGIRSRLKKELASLYRQSGDMSKAFSQYSEALLATPDSNELLAELEEISNQAGIADQLVVSLTSAAANASKERRAELLLRSADLRMEVGDENEAIETWTQLLSSGDLGQEKTLETSRMLEPVLAKKGLHEQRLTLLESMLAAEEDLTSKRDLISNIADAAELVDRPDRAINAWKTRLESDPEDALALGKLIDLHQREENWQELVQYLEQRSELADSSAGRADLVRVATIQTEQLNDMEGAISSWLSVQGRFGSDNETTDALSILLSAQGKWQELAEVLETATSEQTTRLAAQLATLGSAYGDELDANEKALTALSRCLTIDPNQAEARQQLTGLLKDSTTQKGAQNALAQAYKSTKNWQASIELLEAQLEFASTDEEKVDLLSSGAAIAIDKLDDRPQGLSLLCQALPLAGRTPGLVRKVRELAADENNWTPVAEAFEEAGKRAEQAGDTQEVARIQLALGQLYREHLDRDEDALTAFRSVVSTEFVDRNATQNVVELGCRAGAWNDVAHAICALASSTNQTDTGFLTEMVEAAENQNAIDQAVEALGETLRRFDLSMPVHAEISYILANWHFEKRNDDRTAAVWLQEVVRTNPGHLKATEMLVDVLRKTPNEKLFSALQSLIDLRPRDLSIRLEAARVAVEQDVEEEKKRAALGAFLGEFRRSPEKELEDDASWAVQFLVQSLSKSGEHRDALAVLQDAAGLPLDDYAKQAIRVQAAEIAESTGDTSSAIEIFRSILVRNSKDSDATERLQSLFAGQQRYSELLALKQTELAHTESPERRIQLRLEIVETLGRIEKQNQPLETLRSNLEESPGHEGTLKALIGRLENEGRYLEAVDALRTQAELVDQIGQNEQAAMLWQWTGRVAEHQARIPEVALEAYRRSASHDPSAPALDALARIYIASGRSPEAVPWLEQRLHLTEEQEKPDIWLKLANAYIDGRKSDEAASTLKQVIEARPDSMEPRELLATVLRKAERWEELAEHLSGSLSKITSNEQAGSWAREAADLYHRVGKPELAIPALEIATTENSEDKELRSMLALSLMNAERTNEAKEILDELIATFGRRRTKERAKLHVSLSQLHKLDGNLEASYSELETASKMDVENQRTSLLLAQTAADLGNYSQAEKTLRGLLIASRRSSDSEIGESNIQLELRRIAIATGDEEQAETARHNALEAAAKNNVETIRMCQDLAARNEIDFALDTAAKRLEVVKDLGSKQSAPIFKLQGELFAQAENSEAKSIESFLLAANTDVIDTEAVRSALAVAKRADLSNRFVEELATMLDGRSHDEADENLGECFMMLGDLAKTELEDSDRANEFYSKAQNLESHYAEALFAKVNTSTSSEMQASTFDAIDELVSQAETASGKANLQYRLAELQLNRPVFVERGLETLSRALGFEPRYQEAGSMLRELVGDSENSSSILDLYERVARAAHDSDLLLDYLEKRANAHGATPKQVREAVEYSAQLGQPGRGVNLLEQTVEQARHSEEGLAGTSWAATALIRSRIAVGELAPASELLTEVSLFADQETVRSLALELAGRSKENEETLPLAAQSYEVLLAQSPLDREIWTPLTEVYDKLEETEKLHNLVSATVPLLTNPEERNELRVNGARSLLLHGQTNQAESLLRDALQENPDDNDAAVELEVLFMQSGDEDDLADFLMERFGDAKDRGQAQTAALTAIRIGALWQETERGNPLDIYQQALDVAPDHPDLLRLSVEAWPEDGSKKERALLMLSLLRVEELERCEDLALNLATIWESLEDPRNTQKTLELCATRLPESTSVRNRLEEHYRTEQAWEPLADFLTDLAEKQEPDVAVNMFIDAARICRDELEDPARAVAILSAARTNSPNNTGLVTALAESHVAAGDPASGVSCVSTVLEGQLEGVSRIPLLLMRSRLRTKIGEIEASVVDLEEAYSLDGDATFSQLLEGLEGLRSWAVESNELGVERASTLRLAELLKNEDSDRSRGLLLAWIERTPDDVEALRSVRDTDTETEHWEGVMAACSRLALIEDGDDQADAAIRMYKAAEQLGAPEHSKSTLEHVFRIQPERTLIREYLRGVYTEQDNRRELAELLLVDAEQTDEPDDQYKNYMDAANILVNEIGDAEAALPAVEKAQALRPDDHSTVLLLADVYASSGHIDDALAILEPAIAGHKKRSPELASLQYRMAKVFAYTGETDSQLVWLKKAFDVDRKDGAIAAELAQLATEIGDFDLALKPLRAITLMDSPGPVTRVMALLWEAKIENARGNKAKAELWAKKALREDPEFEEAQEFLTELSE